MKKVMKIIVGILLVIGIGIGGIGYMQHKEHEEMVAIATSEEAKKVYEDMMYHLDEKALTEDGVIQWYKVDESSLKYNPMGGLNVSVIVNEDEYMDISYNLIDNGDGTYHSTFYTVSPKLSKTLKEEIDE
ncbi:TPA: DUF1310 family protein [Streptococcus suis]|uniref:DUF1310 family protein n=1 Tax=Streptococcus TaxID=1301 RepID=UPI001961A0EF|nr:MULTISPECIES: DUF1310 family protein [Streptococcus]MBM7192973.1 DUF1310 family protein [Streptococcus suis]MBY0719511.1 DUF1310 domain-containing protein [Streptococcus sp. 2018110]MCO8207321.1 DUF1310 domain-containing protein [Streptococcus suis]MCO8211664.1 DUF1310 domain-containing protein [Streptococcus suis]MCO8225216.1 DUF1310 domain-containing protein [Streptococcus suis]